MTAPVDRPPALKPPGPPRYPPWPSPKSAPRATSSPGMLNLHTALPPAAPAAPAPAVAASASAVPSATAAAMPLALEVNGGHRNLSSGSTLSETGSLDRAKAALERRKKAAEENVGSTGSGGRVETTRVHPGNLIDELLRTTDLHPDESAETSGLQLFIAKDGTTALGNHEVKSQMSTGVFKQVVMEEDR